MSKVRPRTKLVAIHPVHGYAIPPPQDVKVSRRNARERNRVKSVNNGFEMLKRHVPSAAPVKKMSKVNILTQAVEYIESLQSLLDEVPQPSKPVASSPFPPQTFQPGGQTYQNYPGPPLTPISPNTMYYPQPPTAFTPRHYESGYDSNQEQFPEHHHQYHNNHQHHLQYNKVSPLSPPDSSVSASSPAPGYMVPPTIKSREESSGEEDDILDAIAEWQQQD